AVMSVRVVWLRSSINSPLIALIDSGTSWTFCSRSWAVTMITLSSFSARSSSWASAGAPAKAHANASADSDEWQANFEYVRRMVLSLFAYHSGFWSRDGETMFPVMLLLGFRDACPVLCCFISNGPE